MRKITTIFVLLFFISDINSQTLTQSGFISILCPQYMASGDLTRLPYVFRAKVTGLSPSTLYRYFNQAARYTDLGTSNPGAGNPMLISPDGTTYTYTTSPGLTTNYGTFTTDANGDYEGWFAFVHTANTRFTAGNYIIPSIVIGSSSGTLISRRALDDSLLVLAFSTSPGTNNGTGIWGSTYATAKNIIVLYDNVTGTGKPIAMTYLESEGISVANTVGYYTTNVNGLNGRWGSIIPNSLATGIRRVEERSAADASVINFNTDSDGLWPSGANTVNPSGGSSNPVILTEDDIPLPVVIGSMTIEVKGNNVYLRWQTLSEINNAGFTIMRKDKSSSSWTEVSFMVGKGNSSVLVEYSFTDTRLSPGEYNYRLRQKDYNGSEETFDFTSSAYVRNPESFNLSQNYPNPSNPSSVIEFTLPEKSSVSLKVYDISGKTVATLAEGKYEAGYHQVTFRGESLASGIYFYRLEARSANISYSRTMKMILIR